MLNSDLLIANIKLSPMTPFATRLSLLTLALQR